MGSEGTGTLRRIMQYEKLLITGFHEQKTRIVPFRDDFCAFHLPLLRWLFGGVTRRFSGSRLLRRIRLRVTIASTTLRRLKFASLSHRHSRLSASSWLVVVS